VALEFNSIAFRVAQINGWSRPEGTITRRDFQCISQSQTVVPQVSQYCFLIPWLHLEAEMIHSGCAGCWRAAAFLADRAIDIDKVNQR